MGKECTRACGFCDIDFNQAPPSLEQDEPMRVAESAKALGLNHVVLTMVARDDLEDGGALHLVKVIEEIRRHNSSATIEILTSDFQGNEKAYDLILKAKPEIFNYNIETVRALTPRIRHKATYDRTLSLLRYVKQNRQDPKMHTKSGIMVGLGESSTEVKETIFDLKEAGCDIITIGQYLQPNRNKLRVKEFVTPEQFKVYEEYGKSIGVRYMYCGPFVRSSYNAHEVQKSLIS
jgi:lipoic acid synthetase